MSNKNKKYKIPVTIETVASTNIGMVEVDSLDEYYDKASELWESKGLKLYNII